MYSFIFSCVSETTSYFRSGFFIFIYSGMEKEWIEITPDNAEVGFLVKHPQFGIGKIMSIRPDFTIARINFNNYGDKDIRINSSDKYKCEMLIMKEVSKKQKERVRWYRHGKLQESYAEDDIEYTLGQEVIVNGEIDDRKFKNYHCKIVEIGNDSFLIQPLEKYDGYGTETWWVSRYDMKPAEPPDKTVKVRWYKKGKLHESYFTGTGGDLEGFKNKLKNKIGHDFELKGNKLYFMASEDEETEKQLKDIAKPFGVKIQLENMNNIKDFNSFVNEEYMYRNDPSTKPERYEKQRQYFIKQITKLSKDKSKEELEKMSIEDLGKLLNKIKKEM